MTDYKQAIWDYLINANERPTQLQIISQEQAEDAALVVCIVEYPCVVYYVAFIVYDNGDIVTTSDWTTRPPISISEIPEAYWIDLKTNRGCIMYRGLPRILI